MTDSPTPSASPAPFEATPPPQKKSSGAVRLVVALLAIAAMGFAVWKTGLWDMLQPPKYEIPANLTTSDQEKAVRIAQDKVRGEKGRFVRLENTVLFEDQFGNYRVRGSTRNPFTSKKAVYVYQAIVDAKTFDILEFELEK